MIHWFFFSNDVFALDSVIKRIASCPRVRKVDVFIPISTEYHKEVIIKEFEKKLVNKVKSLWTKISNAVA